MLFTGVQSSCKITTPFGPFSDYFLKKRNQDEIVNVYIKCCPFGPFSDYFLKRDQDEIVNVYIKCCFKVARYPVFSRSTWNPS